MENRKFVLLFNFLIGLVFPSDPLHATTDSLKWNVMVRPVEQLLEERKFAEAQLIALDLLTELSIDSPHHTQYQCIIYGILGDCSLELVQLAEARSFYQEALTLIDTTSNERFYADILNKMGNYYLRIKDFRQAQPLLQKALVIRRKWYGDDHLLVSDIYNNLGISYLYDGDFQKALDFQQQALRIREKSLDSPHPLLGQTYQNLGLCYQDAGRVDDAIAAFESSLGQYAQSEAYAIERADVLLNLGNTFSDQSEPDRAIGYFEQALKLYKESGADEGMAVCYQNLGNSWLVKDQAERSETLHLKALEIRRKLFGEVHPEVAESWYNLAHVYRLADDPDKPIKAFQSCLHSLRFEPQKEQYLDQVNAYPLLTYSLYYLADMYYIKYLINDDISYLPEAIRYLNYSDELLDYLRVRYETSRSQLNLVYLGRIVYESAINILLEAEKKSGEAKYLHQAFRYSEKSKALLLLDGLFRSKANAFGEVPQEILKEITQLENDLVNLEKEKYLHTQAPHNEVEKVDSLDHLIFLKNQSFSSQLKTIRSSYPKYYELRYDNPVPSIPAIQRDLLDQDHTLLEYFIGSELYIFVINDDDFQVVTVPIGQDFSYHLDTLNSTIRQFPFESTLGLADNIDRYVNSAYRLYQYLIAPVEKYLKRHLIIVPDERLGYLPFDALLTESIDNFQSFRNHPYLVRKHSISYNYSASLLEEMQSQNHRKTATRYVGFAPDFSGMREEGLADLLFNRDEVAQAQKQLGGDIYLGEEATKSTFLSNQPNYGIIHLATHGMVNASTDDFSFLAFTKKDANDTEADYLLYLREIYNLPIHARMVILSACETATGTLYEGEGIASIARGFSYAGAHSLVATRWNVNDKTTSQLIGLFLANIKEGMYKDDALQKATVDYISRQNDHYAHPFYWSSFLAIGEMHPVLQTDFKWRIVMVAMLVCGILFFLLYKMRKNAHS